MRYFYAKKERNGKNMKKSIKIAIIIVTIVCAYLIGTTQAKTLEKEVIPEGYVDSESCDFYNNYIDMRKVTDFSVNNDGLQLYLKDGGGYYWER